MDRLLIALVALSLVFSGCFLLEEEEEENVTENVTPPPPPPPPNPGIAITSPTEGETILMEGETSDVTLVLSSQNLVLMPPGGTKQTGEGHFRLTLDGTVMGTFASKIHVIEGLGPGSHTLEVELLHNDGTSYMPRIAKQVTFTLEQQEPEEYEPQEYNVIMKDFEYEPASLTVKQTDSVTWVNEGNFPRSATCFKDGAEVFNTGVLGPGQSRTLAFNDVLECEYYSTTHPPMKGTLTVESNE
ncbi:hypothetical protein GF318_06045 [Candidatus Micrarchaeota archaeon]|nr:hypothetical protein [Candidatus Micrarchaeota archaeon]